MCSISVPANAIFIEPEFEWILPWVWTSAVDQNRCEGISAERSRWSTTNGPVWLNPAVSLRQFNQLGSSVGRRSTGVLGGGGSGLLTPLGTRRRIHGSHSSGPDGLQATCVHALLAVSRLNPCLYQQGTIEDRCLVPTPNQGKHTQPVLGSATRGRWGGRGAHLGGSIWDTCTLFTWLQWMKIWTPDHKSGHHLRLILGSSHHRLSPQSPLNYFSFILFLFNKETLDVKDKNERTFHF